MISLRINIDWWHLAATGCTWTSQSLTNTKEVVVRTSYTNSIVDDLLKLSSALNNLPMYNKNSRDDWRERINKIIRDNNLILPEVYNIQLD